MTKALASIVSLAVIVALAATGAVACPCGDADEPGGARGGCHETETGLTAAPMSCGCACLTPVPAGRTATRIEPIVVGAAGIHDASPVREVAPIASRPVATAAALPAPPPPLRHQILRI